MLFRNNFAKRVFPRQVENIFTMTQHDISLRIPQSQVRKQRVFDWGLKTALLWILLKGLFKQFRET